MYCIGMSACCRNNGWGLTGELPWPQTGSEPVFLPVFLENLCLYREGIQEKDWPAGMLNRKTALLAMPVRSLLLHLLSLCDQLCLLQTGKKNWGLLSKYLVLPALWFGDFKSPGFEIVLCIEAYWHQRLTLINLICGRPQSEPDCFIQSHHI